MNTQDNEAEKIADEIVNEMSDFGKMSNIIARPGYMAGLKDGAMMGYLKGRIVGYDKSIEKMDKILTTHKGANQ